MAAHLLSNVSVLVYDNVTTVASLALDLGLYLDLDPNNVINNTFYNDTEGIFDNSSLSPGNFSSAFDDDLVVPMSSQRPPHTATFGTVSREDYLMYRRIFTWIKVIGQPISVLCLVLSACVYLRKGMRNPTTCYLVAFCMLEAFAVSLQSIYQICILSKRCEHSNIFAYYIYLGNMYLSASCRRSVYIFNSLVSIHRFVVIAFPMRSLNMPSLNRSGLICVVVVSWSLLAHAYLFFRYHVSLRGSAAYFVTSTAMAHTHKNIFMNIAMAVTYLTVYIPLLTGTLANIGMVVSLFRHTRRMTGLKSVRASVRHRGGRESKKMGSSIEVQTTAVVLVSTFLFTLFSLPTNINLVVKDDLDDYGRGSREHYLYLTLSELFVLGQLTSDFIIFGSYIGLSTAFRHHLLAIITPCCCKAINAQGSFSRSEAADSIQLSRGKSGSAIPTVASTV